MLVLLQHLQMRLHHFQRALNLSQSLTETVHFVNQISVCFANTSASSALLDEHMNIQFNVEKLLQKLRRKD